MGIRTAWQAIAQPPGRFLASSWPWRSLAYLLCGIAPSAAVAAGVIALFSRPVSRAAPVVLPLVALALLGSGPVVARYERWRLRLVHTGLDPGRRRAEGAGHRALEAGYGVVCVVVLWLIDLAVVALSLFLSAGLTVMALRSADSGGGVRAAMLVAAVALLPVAAYPITAWAGARSALAKAILAPRSWSWTGGWSRSPGRGRVWSTRSSWTGGGSSATCTTAPSSGWSRSPWPSVWPGSTWRRARPPRRRSTPPTSRPGRRWRSCGS